jgi:hypothetical protein
MTDRVYEYRLVQSSNPVDFVKNVNNALCQGWHLNGSAFWSEKYEHFYQPMVKYELPQGYTGPW